jgi:hypothetical protein
MNAIKITLIGLLAAFPAHAQESMPAKSHERQIGLSLGFQQRHLLDEQKSALVYYSAEYTAGLFFRHLKDKSIFSIDLAAGKGSYSARHINDRWFYTNTYDLDGSVTTDSFPVASGILSGLLQVSYLRKAGRGTNIRWYAGPALKDLIVYPENNIGLLNSLGLYASLYADRNFGTRTRLGAGLSLPLVAINSRLPWHNTATDPLKSETVTFFRKGTRLVSVNKFLLLQCNLNVGFQITQRLNLGADYSFVWLRVPYYQPMKSAIHTVVVKTAYTF